MLRSAASHRLADVTRTSRVKSPCWLVAQRGCFPASHSSWCLTVPLQGLHLHSPASHPGHGNGAADSSEPCSACRPSNRDLDSLKVYPARRALPAAKAVQGAEFCVLRSCCCCLDRSGLPTAHVSTWSTAEAFRGLGHPRCCATSRGLCSCSAASPTARQHSSAHRVGMVEADSVGHSNNSLHRLTQSAPAGPIELDRPRPR